MYKHTLKNLICVHVYVIEYVQLNFDYKFIFKINIRKISTNI